MVISRSPARSGAARGAGPNCSLQVSLNGAAYFVAQRVAPVLASIATATSSARVAIERVERGAVGDDRRKAVAEGPAPDLPRPGRRPRCREIRGAGHEVPIRPAPLRPHRADRQRQRERDDSHCPPPAPGSNSAGSSGVLIVMLSIVRVSDGSGAPLNTARSENGSFSPLTSR